MSGSVHDSRDFRESHLCTLFERGKDNINVMLTVLHTLIVGHCTGDYDGILVGDRGYACRQYFMTPFPDPNPVTMQL